MGILGWLGVGKDIKDSADGIGDNVSKIISVARGKLPPEQQIELEKIQADVETKLAGIRAQSESVLRDFIIQYEGSADQVKPFIQVWRGLIRPLFTTFFLVLLMGIVAVDAVNILVHHIPLTQLLLNNLPTGLWWLFGVVLTFWFGGRMGEHLVEKLNGKKQ